MRNETFHLGEPLLYKCWYAGSLTPFSAHLALVVSPSVGENALWLQYRRRAVNMNYSGNLKNDALFYFLFFLRHLLTRSWKPFLPCSQKLFFPPFTNRQEREEETNTQASKQTEQSYQDNAPLEASPIEHATSLLGLLYSPDAVPHPRRLSGLSDRQCSLQTTVCDASGSISGGWAVFAFSPWHRGTNTRSSFPRPAVLREVAAERPHKPRCLDCGCQARTALNLETWGNKRKPLCSCFVFLLFLFVQAFLIENISKAAFIAYIANSLPRLQATSPL